MANRFNTVTSNPYQGLPLDLIYKAGLSKDDDTQKFVDKYEKNIAGFNALGAYYDYDKEYLKNTLGNYNSQLGDLIKGDITNPQNQNKINQIINNVGQDRNIVETISRNKAASDYYDYVSKNPGKFSPAERWEWESKMDAYDKTGKGDVTKFTPFSAYYDVDGEVLKKLGEIDNNGESYIDNDGYIHTLSGRYSRNDNGDLVRDKRIESLTSNLSFEANEQLKRNYKYYADNNPDFVKDYPDLESYLSAKGKQYANQYSSITEDLKGGNKSGGSGGSGGSGSNVYDPNGSLPPISISNKSELLPNTDNSSYTQSVGNNGYAHNAYKKSDGLYYDKNDQQPVAKTDVSTYKYKETGLPEFSEFSYKQSGVLDKIMDGEAYREDITNAKYKNDLQATYKKYKDGKTLSKPEQVQMSHMIDLANTWVGQHGEDKTSYRNYVLKESDGIVYSQPFKNLPFKAYEYYDPETGKVISGKDLPDGLKPQSDNSKVIGKMYGAAGFDRNEQNEVGFSNGYRVVIDDGSGGYKEYIMQNPNGDTPDNKYEGFANDAKMFENQWNTIDGGYKLFYEPNTDIFQLRTPDGESFKVTNGKETTDKIPPKNIKQIMDHIYNTSSQQKPVTKSTQFKYTDPDKDPSLVNKTTKQDSFSKIPAFNDDKFSAELDRVSDSLGVKSRDLMGVILRESGGNPGIKNTQKKENTATGLIQFVEKTAKELGTTTDELKAMTASQQMKYVEKFFKNVGIKPGASAGEIYAAIYLPGRRGNKYLSAKGEGYYEENKGLDFDEDGYITIADLDKVVGETLQKYNYN